MGLSVGLVIGFLGVGILIAPIVMQIYLSTKLTNTNHKRALEGASGIIGLGLFFFIGGLILAAYYSTGKGIISESEAGGKFLEEHPQLALLAA